MIKPPSIQGPYSLVWSGDPALNLPDPGPERDRVLLTAAERGDYSDLILPGQTPTVFQCRRLPQHVREWVNGERVHSSVFNRPLSDGEFFILLFRAALKSIDNWSQKIQWTSFGKDCPTIVHEDTTDAMSTVDHGLLIELAIAVWRKETTGLSPKS